MTFPEDFLWGAATASYQIEGGGLDDGRGECIWYRFSHTPGNVVNGDTGDVACDHYHRFRDDVALMKKMGLHTYRFSVSWPRVLPEGTGRANPPGLIFYDQLVDALLEAGIIPFVTLYHWDLPQTLQDRGGWENPDSIEWFGEYTQLMTRKLGDRVQHWITLNEPWVIAFLGNLLGIHAPGKKDVEAAYQVAHHLLMAHGHAVPLVRETVPDSRVGITLNLNYVEPASDSDADVQAARRAEGFANRWFLDPVYKGRYPEDMVAWLGDKIGHLDLEAVKVAAVATDFLGINYYTRNTIAHADTGLFQSQSIKHDHERYTAMDWEIYPVGLTNLLVQVHQDYAPATIYITENGAAFDDPKPAPNGLVDDPERVDYLREHFAAASAAIEQGVPLEGYFIWSLLDNFEWAFGYSKRFGIVYVDYSTQRRYPKQSALYLQSVIQGNA